MERITSSSRFPLGSKLPKFSLKNVDGRYLGSDYLQNAKAALVVFGCNHCPFVKGSEESLIQMVRRYEVEGLRTVMINSNDALQYPEDSYERMQDKAAAMQLPYPYLYDETQEVAKVFDAACTPECYVFNEKQELVYHGTVNDSLRERSKAAREYLRDAVEAALAGEKVREPFVRPLGCSIKWRYVEPAVVNSR